MADRCWCFDGDDGREHDYAADMSDGFDVVMRRENDGLQFCLHITDHCDGGIATFDFQTIEQARAFAEQVRRAVEGAAAQPDNGFGGGQ